MQWVRAACVRPAPAMRVCARSYLGRASIVKTVVDIATTFKCLCLSVSSRVVCLSVSALRSSRELDCGASGSPNVLTWNAGPSSH